MSIVERFLITVNNKLLKIIYYWTIVKTPNCMHRVCNHPSDVKIDTNNKNLDCFVYKLELPVINVHLVWFWMMLKILRTFIFMYFNNNFAVAVYNEFPVECILK